MDKTQGTNRAKFYQLALFPMNNGATNVYFVLILTYIATFGNKVLGLSMIFASFMVTGMRVLDVVTDPIIGAIMDKTNGRLGKFRPFMILGNLVMAVAVTLLYVLTPKVPHTKLWLRYALFILLYAVWVLGYTLQTSVTRSGQAVLTNDPKQRPLFTVFNIVASLAGMGIMNVMGPLLAGDSFAGDYNATWFAMMTPVGIVLSLILTIFGMIGIWKKDRSEYFGLGGTQERIAPREYVTVLKGNKPLRRLMIAGGSCKLALAIATNVTILCILYGSMTQFGLGINKGEALSGVVEVNTGSAEIMVGLQVEENSQVLGITFDEAPLESRAQGYQVNLKTGVKEISAYTARELFRLDEQGRIRVVQPVDAVAVYVNEKGQIAPLKLGEDNRPEGLQTDKDGRIIGLSTSSANRIVGVLVSRDGDLINTENLPLALGWSENKEITGLRAEDTVKLSGRNGYDKLYLVMMALGYVFSAPFFLLTVRTARKHGQKKSLVTYVTVALLCYVVVAALMILWRFGDPDWNMAVYEGTPFGSDFRITINLYTILFLVFFGIGYGAYYATADMPIPMVADCADYEMFRSGKFIPGILGTMFSLVDKLVSSLASTVVSVGLLCIGILDLPTKATPYVQGMNWLVVIMFCLVPMLAWVVTLWSMAGYDLDGKRIKTVQRVNAERKKAIADGMTKEAAMQAITEETVTVS